MTGPPATNRHDAPPCIAAMLAHGSDGMRSDDDEPTASLERYSCPICGRAPQPLWHPVTFRNMVVCSSCAASLRVKRVRWLPWTIIVGVSAVSAMLDVPLFFAIVSMLFLARISVLLTNRYYLLDLPAARHLPPATVVRDELSAADMSDERWLAVYQRQGFWFLQPEGKVEEFGYLVHTGPVARLNTDNSPAQLGRAIREALAHSRPVPRPSEPRRVDPAVLRPLLESSGTRSWGAFARLARVVDVELSADMLSLQANRRVRDSFEPTDDPPIELAATCSDEELGRAAIRALESSS